MVPCNGFGQPRDSLCVRARHRVVAILGVDFPAFPRRFAKCETRGVSLMDIGAGAVVLVSGLARLPRPAPGGDRGTFRGSTFRGRWAFLAAVGVGKFLAHTAVGYQVCGLGPLPRPVPCSLCVPPPPPPKAHLHPHMRLCVHACEPVFRTMCPSMVFIGTSS